MQKTPTPSFLPRDNPYASRARSRKVSILLTELANLCRGFELWTETNTEAIATMLEGWTAAQWASLAIMAGCRPPSEQTRALVVARVRERGR